MSNFIVQNLKRIYCKILPTAEGECLSVRGSTVEDPPPHPATIPIPIPIPGYEGDVDGRYL